MHTPVRPPSETQGRVLFPFVACYVPPNDDMDTCVLILRFVLLKVDIHEIEERKNLHINDLMKNHEKAFGQMKAYYNDITNDNLKVPVDGLMCFVLAKSSRDNAGKVISLLSLIADSDASLPRPPYTLYRASQNGWVLTLSVTFCDPCRRRLLVIRNVSFFVMGVFLWDS